MAHYFGSVQGMRGEASRLGSPASGLTTIAASWSGAVRTRLYQEAGVECARVELTPWQGRGVSRVLYDGPVGDMNAHATADINELLRPAIEGGSVPHDQGAKASSEFAPGKAFRSSHTWTDPDETMATQRRHTIN
jgi:hypothetical protein